MKLKLVTKLLSDTKRREKKEWIEKEALQRIRMDHFRNIMLSDQPTKDKMMWLKNHKM